MIFAALFIFIPFLCAGVPVRGEKLTNNQAQALKLTGSGFVCNLFSFSPFFCGTERLRRGIFSVVSRIDALISTGRSDHDVVEWKTAKSNLNRLGLPTKLRGNCYANAALSRASLDDSRWSRDCTGHDRSIMMHR